MLKVAFKPNGLMNFGDIVHDLLTDPAGLLDFQVKVRGEGSINVTVPSTTDFFHGGTAGATFHWNDLTKTTGTDGPQFDISDLSELVNFDFDPSNPKALFSIILKTLQTLDKTLGDGDPSGASVFNTKIPLVGRSLHDLLKSDESGLGPNVTYTANTVKDASRSVAKGNAFPQNLVGRSIVAGTQVGIVASVTDDTLTMASNWTNQPSPATPYTLRSELDDAISILQNSPSDNLQALGQDAQRPAVGLADPVRLPRRRERRQHAVARHQPRLDSATSTRARRCRSTSRCRPVPAVATTRSPACRAAARCRSARAVRSSSAWSCRWLREPARRTPSASADPRRLEHQRAPRRRGRRRDARRRRSARSASRSATRPAPTRRPPRRATRSTSRRPAATGNAESFDDFFGAGGVGADINATECRRRLRPRRRARRPRSRCARSCRSTSATTAARRTRKLIADPDPNAFNLRLPKIGRVTHRLLRPHRRADRRPRPARVPGPDRRSPNAIASHIIDFTRLDGLDSFLNLIEQSLNTASFGGKLPLIGDDLQQGADFIGKIRDAVHDALGQLPNDGNLGDMAGVRDWVNDKLEAGAVRRGREPRPRQARHRVLDEPRRRRLAERRAAQRRHRRRQSSTTTRSRRTSPWAATRSSPSRAAIGSIANGPDDAERHGQARHQLDRGHRRQRLQGVPRRPAAAPSRKSPTSRRPRRSPTTAPRLRATSPRTRRTNPQLHDCTYDSARVGGHRPRPQPGRLLRRRR